MASVRDEQTDKAHKTLFRIDLEDRASALENFLDRNKVVVLCLITVVYFAGEILRARAKPFWFDEILTLIAAQRPDLPSVLKAVRELDWMPPLTHLTGHLLARVAGSGEVVFRLPSMIGFWIFCLCLFRFAARRVTIGFALAAMLLPFATGATYYATEARCYGLLLGFSAIALVCWQTATAEERRTAALLGLAIGGMGALFCHYYAIFLYAALVGAEGFRTFRRRTIDGWIWAAFSAGGIPVVASLLTILRVTKENQHPVSQASFKVFGVYYESQLGGSAGVAAVAMLLISFAFAFAGYQLNTARESRSIPGHEWLAAAILLLVGPMALGIALAIPPHIFMDRYALISVAGFALLSAFIASYIAASRSVVALAFALAASVGWFHSGIPLPRRLVNPLDQHPMFLHAIEDGPVIVNNNVLFLELWYYAPANLKSNVMYLSDEASFLKYVHFDENMGNFHDFGVPVMDYRAFVARHPQFLIYVTPGWGWLPQKITDDGGSINIVRADGNNYLLSAIPK